MDRNALRIKELGTPVSSPGEIGFRCERCGVPASLLLVGSKRDAEQMFSCRRCLRLTKLAWWALYEYLMPEAVPALMDAGRRWRWWNRPALSMDLPDAMCWCVDLKREARGSL